MRIFPLIVIILLSLGLTVLFAFVDRKALENPIDDSSKVVLSNRYIKVCVAGDGRFTEGTPDGRRLLYGFPAEGGPSATSNTVFNIDGEFYSNASYLGVREPSLIVSSTVVDSAVLTIWEIDSIVITQILRPVVVSLPSDETGTLLIKYRFENRSSRLRRVGLRLLLDTMINRNDAAPIASSFGYSGVEQDFHLAYGMPQFWRAYEFSPDQPPEYLVGEGTLIGGEAVPPDRFCLGSYPRYARVIWDYVATGGPYGDSAVLLWWYPQQLAPGDTFEVATYYGLGFFALLRGRLNLNLMVPVISSRGCRFYPNPFDINLLVTNPNLTTVESVSARLILPLGLDLANAEDSVHMVQPPTLPRYATGFTSWHPRLTGEIADDTLDIAVVVRSPSIDAPETIRTRLYIPPLAGTIDASITYPPNNVITSCSLQAIRLRFAIDAQPIIPAHFRMSINGVVFDETSPRFSVADSEIVFVPDVPFSSGESVFVSVYSAVDSFGCELGETPTAMFIVDTEGPIADEPFPLPGSVISESNPTISLSLFDRLTEVVDSSIILTINGEEFRVGEHLRYSGGMLIFEPSAMDFSDGETVSVCVVRAFDSPQLCEPNQLENAPFCWSFTIEFIDIALPDTFAFSGDTILYPVSVQDLTGIDASNFEFDFQFDGRFIVPISVEPSPTFPLDTIIFRPSTNRLNISGTFAHSPAYGGTLFYIKCFVPYDAYIGAYSDITVVRGGLNDGRLKVNSSSGSVLVNGRAGAWTVELIFRGTQSRTAENVLVFGLSPDASEFFDPGIDRIAIPSPISVDAYFPLTDPNYPYITRLQKDIRGISDSVVWQIETANEENGIVSWMPSLFPRFGRFMLNNIMDMRTDSVYHFTINETLTVAYSFVQPVVCSLSLSHGWNLIAFSVLPPYIDSFDDLLPFVMSVVTYSPLRGYFNVSVPERGCGYWVFSQVDTVIRFGGVVDNSINLPVYAGWNLVGGISTDDIPLELLQTEPPGIIVSAFAFDNISLSYSPVDTIKPNVGYWVLSISDGFIRGGSYRMRR